MVYEMLQGPASVEKAENSYANVAQKIIGLKGNSKINISKRPVAVTIRPRGKEKLKSIDKVKMALQERYRPSKDNVRMKMIVKRKKDILVETNTIESLEKLKESSEMRKKFEVQEVTRNKLKFITYGVSHTFSERQVSNKADL